MHVLPLAIFAIFGFSLYTLMQAWSTDGIVHRAHALLQRAKNGAPDAAKLLEECCEECRRAAARNPNDAYICKIWGAALWCRGRSAPPGDADRLYVQAEQKYLTALESKPDDVALSLDLFWVLYDRAALHVGPAGFQLLERICDECERLLILHPNDTGLLSFWGNALECLGNRASAAEADRLYAAAEDKYTQALAAKPTEQPIMNSLATLLWRRARRAAGEDARLLLTRAGQWLDSALAVNSADTRTLSARAWVLFSLSRLQPGEETNRMLQEAASRFAVTEDPQLHQAAGLILWAQGALEAAKQKLTSAESHEPGSASYNLACVCAQLGQESECREWLERSGEPGILVSPEQMSTESELAAVRDLPWFRDLVGATR